MSMDGFVAGPNGEHDWIVMDPAFDFEGYVREFDTILMGRRTFEIAGAGGGASMPGVRTIVCSRTLLPADHPKITIADDAVDSVRTLKREAGKDIWLFGGGELFRSLLEAKLVDTIEVAVVPIALSQGVPLLPAGKRSPQLRLLSSKILPSGVVTLNYSIIYGGGLRKPKQAGKPGKSVKH
jgi:dihydrofolate reductase